MDQQTLVTFVWLIPLLPLLAFFTIVLFARGRDRLSHTIAIGAIAISFVLAQIVFWNAVTQSSTQAAEKPAAEAPATEAGAQAQAEKEAKEKAKEKAPE